VVDWETNYDSSIVSSRLEWAMRLLIENEDSFWSEQQNYPHGKRKDSIFVDAVTIRNQLNGYERGIVPVEAQHLTAFIDVHDDILYYVIVAWAQDFTGYIIDYNTFPEQVKSYFHKTDRNNETLQKKYRGSKRLGGIRSGVEDLFKELLSRKFKTAEDTFIHLKRIMIDTGFSYREVEMAMSRVPSPLITPTKGVGINAKAKPMDEYPDRDGEIRGFHWLQTKVGKHRFPTVKIDTNFWKTDVHDSFGLTVGDRGGLSLWGIKPEIHQMFSEHVAAEDVILVKAGENEVYEWSIEKSGGRDNHFFDCLVGNMVAASFDGIKKPHEKNDTSPTHRRRQVF
jgi:phage terminase large subunit GpA-like protein